jgi:hypothetical protein
MIPRMRRRDRWIQRLAAWDERCRVRLHRAANRAEDADPLDVAVAEAAIHVLNAIDRVTGFRAAHEAANPVPVGERRPLPPVVPNESPPKRVKGGRERR